MGYSYLTISLSVTQASENKYCWTGRVFLSPANGLITPGGVLSIITDYKNPDIGSYSLNVQELWDSNGNNLLCFSATFLSAGTAYYKIYG